MTHEELDSCITPPKDFYSGEEVLAMAKGTGWVIGALIGCDHIRPVEGSDGEVFSRAEVEFFAKQRHRTITIGEKIKEGHARRRNGLPAKNSLPKEYAPVKGVVYIVECGGRYKIGKTQNLPFRFAHFTIVLPFEPTLIHLIASDNITQTERDLHVKYKGKRVRGEWFDLTQEDIDRIKQIG